MTIRTMVCLLCLGFVITTGAGCSTAGSASADSWTADQELMDLTRRYETGALSKDEYERQRAEMLARRDREGLQSGSPMNETVRGMRSVR